MWAKDLKIGNRMFNARLETIATKSVFKGALARRRCLVLADGFYEWKAEGKRKIPYVVRTEDGAPFAMAGLWDIWKSQDREVVESCTIITREAAGQVAAIHDRMPVVLELDALGEWLDESERDGPRLVAFLAASARTSFIVEPIEAVPTAAPPTKRQMRLI